MAPWFLLFALLVALVPAVSAGHCASAYTSCSTCVMDTRCKFCGSQCAMAADACSAVSLQGADSVVQCPNFDKGTGSAFFESITSAIKGNPAQLNYGVAITDFDGDGEFEAFVAGFGVKNQIYKWNAKEQSMVDIVNGDAVVADATRKAIGVAACDVDGDGHEEVYVLNTDAYGGQTATSDRLLQRDAATGTWRDMFTMPKHASSANFVAGRSCACVDRNGDGKYGKSYLSPSVADKQHFS